MNKIKPQHSYFIFLVFFWLGINPMLGQTVDMEVKQGPNIDVVLTVGITNQNIDTFEEDLGAALESKGIPAGKLYVQGFERTTISSNSEDAADIFNNWVRWGYNPETWEFVDSEKFIRRINNDFMAGFYDPVFDSSNYTLEADIAFTSGSDNDDMGITFGMENGPVGSYLFNLSGAVRSFTTNEFIPSHGFPSGLYRITRDNGAANPQHYVQGLQSAENIIFNPSSITTWYHFKIVVSGKNVKIYMDDALIIDYTATEEIGGSYGFFSNSQPYATFKNIEVTSLSLKKFKDVLREPQWRNSALRFNVNLDDIEVADFDSDQDLSEILMRTINEDIHYIGWGTNANQAQFERFIQQNNTQGTFINRDAGSWSTWMDDMSQYIYDQYQFGTVTAGEFFIAGTSVEIDVDPAQLKSNTANASYPSGRWKITHDETHFANNTGKVSWDGLYLEDVPEFYEKPGKYSFTFEDLPTAPTTLFFHRKPVASFTYSADTGFINNTSYDLDGGANNGINQSEWKWKAVDAGSTNDWTIGQFDKNTVPDGEYLVMLRVQDHQGTWSSPTSIYVEKTASSGGATDLPIAQFNIQPDLINTYTGNMTIGIVDNSVDPYGRTLSVQEWIVTQRTYDTDGNPSDTQIYNAGTPMTDFSAYNNLSADYIISLRTQTNTGVWSEPFYRTLTIVDDNTDPTITANPTSGNLDTDTDIQLVFQDENGGSGFDVQRFAKIQSASAPATDHASWSSWSNSQSKTTSFNTGGTGWYIHAEVKDNAGNVGTATFGPYNVTLVVSADDDLAILDEDTVSDPIDVLYNDVYDMGATPTVTITAQGTKGNAVVNGSNQVIYTPNANENGTDTVTYELDDQGQKVTANITLSILPEDDAPVANDDSFNLDENATLNDDVSTNDVEIDGDDLVYHIITNPSHAAAFTFNPDGTFTYEHNGDESATDSFTYNFEDAISFSQTVTATLNITNVNDVPTGANSTVEVIQDAAYTFTAADFTFTDVDPSDSFNGIQVISLPAKGTLEYNGSAVQINDMIDDISLLTYTTANGEYGDGYSSFAFKVKDNDDAVSASSYTASINASQDTDGDGIPDDLDDDDDNDGTPDSEDAFPKDSSEDTDTDGDGTGDNADDDDDNDGTPDSEDAFPKDASEDTDTDGDGTGDNADDDDDNDGTPDSEDAFPKDASEDTDTDGDGTGDNADDDDDNDGTPDSEDAFPKDASEDTDTDGDGTGDNTDEDDDNDGTPDSEDAFPKDASEDTDTDGDGTGDNTDDDDDNDGTPDSEDAFPKDASEDTDTDGDGTGDNTDDDDDNDGTPDSEDAFPKDASEDTDTDGDGTGDNTDEDDDNDGTPDSEDAFPKDASEDTDTDGDGTGDNTDDDDDNDGTPDSEDAFPKDASEDTDTDGDGTGDNTDDDDDNDGTPDSEDAFPKDSSEDTDTDGDGTGDNADDDDDNDGTPDSEDAFPKDASEDTDTDGDGTGDNTDDDDDNDGTPDSEDAFPKDALEDTDTDGDGTGDNTDDDDDNDGTPDSEDAFPKDASEDTDTDGDGTGDNADDDADNDGVPDTEDAFPNDPNETSDVDGDGVGDNADTDDDNDGVTDTDNDGDGLGDNVDNDDDNDGIPDSEDAFPTDASETVDTDGDGIGDNADTDDDGDGYSDEVELMEGTNPTDASSKPLDTDGDGIPDTMDEDDDNDGVSDFDDAFPTDEEPLLVPAQAFTPNGDGNNDAWIIPGIDNYPNNVVKVYNRWGHEVFATKSYRNDWEGFYKSRNEKLPAGSYLYIIDLGDGSAPLQGWIFINY